MSVNHGDASGAVRAFASALAIAGLLAARAASAWTYPLLPHVQGLAFFPETPNNEQPTSILLSAVYPGECWRYVGGELRDSAYVHVTIERADTCSNDSLSYWTAGFELGVLAAGMHDLTVHCTVLDGALPPAEEEITVAFEIAQGAPPPPPGPGPGLLQSVEVIPTWPAPGEQVQLRLSGHKPFECTLIRDAHLLSRLSVEMTFERQESCVDTARAWSQTFDLGTFTEGDYRADIALHVVTPESTTTQEAAALIRVRDPGGPPPVDSTNALVRSITVLPSAPVAGDVVTVTLRGRYPFDCGTLRDPYILIDNGLSLSLVSAPPCEDTTHTWEYTFDLGRPAPGDQNWHLQLLVPNVMSSQLYDFSFHVTDPNAPPPGPDPYSSLLLGYEVSPPEPHPGDLIRLRLWGREPFDCTATSYSTDLDTGHVEVTFQRLDVACRDTSRAWEHTWDMGALPVGHHNVEINFYLVTPESTHIEHSAALIFVTDPTEPPPPPPGDSLRSTLSASHPNPFSEFTNFAISLAEPTVAQVAVFDLSGRWVATLHNGMLPRGTSKLAWDGKRKDGTRAPGGIYFYRLTLPGRVVTRRVVLLGSP